MLQKFETKLKNESLLDKVQKSFNDKANDVPLGWFSTISTVICVLVLFITSHFFSGILVFLLLCVNLYVVFRENSLKRTELHRKVKKILREIEIAKDLCKDWTPANFPHLCSPLSPCITLQWTIRNGEIINLPWSLLVRGDHIILRPGQVKKIIKSMTIF